MDSLLLVVDMADSLQVDNLLLVADMASADSQPVGRSLLPVVNMADSPLVESLLVVQRKRLVADMADSPQVVRVESLPVANMLLHQNLEVDSQSVVQVEILPVVQRKRLVVAPVGILLVAELLPVVVVVAPLAE